MSAEFPALPPTTRPTAVSAKLSFELWAGPPETAAVSWAPLKTLLLLRLALSVLWMFSWAPVCSQDFLKFYSSADF